MKRGALVLITGLAVFAVVFADPSKSAANELGNKVVAYAKSQMGKKVARGECSELVIAALEAAGARTTNDYGVRGPGKDYVWGSPVKGLDEVQPGDIVQFRNVKMKGQVPIKGKLTNVTMTIPHHTSIVLKSLGKGKFKLLEQNVGGVRLVQETMMDFASKQSGDMWIYRPVKK